MKRWSLVIIIGIVFGALDIIPLIPANAPIFNMVAIAVFWVVAAVVMAKMRFVQNNLLDGLIIAVFLMTPLILTVTAVNPKDFLPMLSMAVILGPLCGLALGKLKLRG